ncbi:MAG: NAD(P)/FAD-dependent oxidoreductase [Flavobacteriales bacterium]|nr:NAD(P)/FAD-dependent oxidoreductase [Flavobacteriales bacterium]
MKEKIVIIGNGISGVTCARYIRKYSDHEIVIISSESQYFFSRTALMYVYMGHMKFEHTQPYENWFWEKNNIDLKQALVTAVNTQEKILILDNGAQVKYSKLVIATGSKPNKFGWPGQDLNGVQGLYSKQDLESLEENTKNGINRAVIVGGGLIGIEMAEMLLSRNFPVTFLVRESAFWGNVLPTEESEMIKRHMKEHHIDLRLNTELKEVLSDANGNARAIITNKGEEIPCQIVGLTAGVSPNIAFIKKSEIETNRGVLVNEFLETNIPDVYAIGDCAEFREHPSGDRRAIEQVWYTGKIMGKTLAQTICNSRLQYNPGHWFNSAKFMDIEYQTYGWVFPKPKENEQHFYWEHGEGKKSVRLNYDHQTRRFIGINTFGIRMRHQAFDKWLNEQRSVEYVLEHLADANFDPEFFKLHEKEIVDQFNRENGTNLVVKKKNWRNLFTVKG